MLVNIQYLDNDDMWKTLVTIGMNTVPAVGDVFKTPLPNGSIADLVVKTRIFSHEPGDIHVDLRCDILYANWESDIGI